MARSFSGTLEDREVLGVYIVGSGDETYEEMWQQISEKEMQGWRLRDVVESPDGSVELAWDRLPG